MNILVKRTRIKYRNARERACYNIMDIEYHLKTLACDGLIWCLQEMPDTSQAEEILISHYLHKYREIQVYDDIYEPQTPSTTATY
ncbi:hypothetical protein [Cytobacillus gottheilii]|uniref:hypothetical protein n=1 Tax=Cytobacillus gottheilii TaxID=859144 RepID=UPI0008373E1F|nr:hypothetical protein [Cytobacillus gottheilii]